MLRSPHLYSVPINTHKGINFFTTVVGNYKEMKQYCHVGIIIILRKRS